MDCQDLLLKQIINGLSLGAMYSLLALGFTMVYGIIELINFAHFNVFMVGSFFVLWVLEATGLIGQRSTLTGLPLIGVCGVGCACTMVRSGLLGIVIERTALRSVRQLRGTAPMILTIGISYVLYNVILLTVGADTHNFPNPIPVIKWQIGGAVLQLREVLVWSVSLALMVGLHFFVRHTRIGKAMQATAQDQEAARMMGVEVDRVVILAFFIGSALAGAAGLIFGLYYNFTSYIIGYSAGLRAFTAAVVGGSGDNSGAQIGGPAGGPTPELGGAVHG